MAQHDYNIANSDGATVRADLNSVFLAIVSSNSGASAPTTTFAYQWWADTTNSLLKQRNAANSAWLVRAPLAAAGVLTKTAAYTVALGDFGKLIDADAAGGDFTITLPVAATAGDGFSVAVKNTGSSGTVTIDGDGAETLDGAASKTLTSQYDGLTLRCDGSEWHVELEKGVSQATQAAIEAETNENTYAPPDLIKHSPGVAKVWGQVTDSGTAALAGSGHNIASVDDDATGDYGVNLTTAFSDANYSAIASALINDRLAVPDGLATGAIEISITRATTGAFIDASFCVAAFGDQ